jgi:signal peptidase I
MEPTLLLGDRVSVERGERVERGAVVAFRIVRDVEEGAVREVMPASRAAGGPVETDIKRVVGLPGDIVAIRGGRLFVNDAAVPQQALQAQRDSWGNPVEVAREQLGDHDYQVFVSPPTGDFAAVPVPPEHVFLLGDNRGHSHDSRHFGPVPLEDVVGELGTVQASSDPRTGQVRPERAGIAVR